VGLRDDAEGRARGRDVRQVVHRADVVVPAARAVTKIVQGWPKLWANFRALIWIFSQRVGPSLAVWANPVQFSLVCG
jgi:hypothetical protein